MYDSELGELQLRFAEMIWEHEPIASGRLVKMCEEEFGWKKPTTYTVLRKLCEKGLFCNENGTVRSVIGKKEFDSARTRRFVDETFHGSLPAFVAAFASQRPLTEEEIDALYAVLKMQKPED